MEIRKLQKEVQYRRYDMEESKLKQESLYKLYCFIIGTGAGFNNSADNINKITSEIKRSKKKNRNSKRN